MPWTVSGLSFCLCRALYARFSFVLIHAAHQDQDRKHPANTQQPPAHTRRTCRVFSCPLKPQKKGPWHAFRFRTYRPTDKAGNTRQRPDSTPCKARHGGRLDRRTRLFDYTYRLLRYCQPQRPDNHPDDARPLSPIHPFSFCFPQVSDRKCTGYAKHMGVPAGESAPESAEGRVFVPIPLWGMPLIRLCPPSCPG